MMLATFFARVRPASTRPKPACMKKTNAPAMNTQRLSSTTCGATPSGTSCAAAGEAKAITEIPAIAAPVSSFLFTPTSYGRRTLATVRRACFSQMPD